MKHKRSFQLHKTIEKEKFWKEKLELKCISALLIACEKCEVTWTESIYKNADYVR